MGSLPTWFPQHEQEIIQRVQSLDPYPFDQPSDCSGYLSCHQNDYLRLSNHPEVAQARNKATLETGSGAMASLIYGGDHGYHQKFSTRVAQAAQCSSPACVMIMTAGWTANVGVMEAVVMPDMPIYIDQNAHASLWDGARLSPGKLIPVRHNRPDQMEQYIRKYGAGVIVVDAFYSTHGSVAPLSGYVDLAEKYDCLLVVDEAHSFALVGKNGGGLCVEMGLADRVHIRTVSLAKGLGGSGGLLLLHNDLHRYLAHRLRSLIFSSAPPPSTSAGNEKAMEIVMREPQRLARTQQRAAQLRTLFNENGVDTGPSGCQIVSLMFPGDREACRLYGALKKRGILFSVFLFPAVPKNMGLARFSIYTDLTEKDIDYIAATTIEEMHNLGIQSKYPGK